MIAVLGKIVFKLKKFEVVAILLKH